MRQVEGRIAAGHVRSDAAAATRPSEPAAKPAPGAAGHLPSREALLRWVARTAVLSLDADGAAASSVLADGTLEVVHCTGAAVREVEGWQSSSGRGPAVTALAYGTMVDVTDLCAVADYPELRVRALLAGLRSVAAVPLGAHGRTNAVVDVWWRRPGGLGDLVPVAEHLQHVVEPVLELIEERDPAYCDPENGARRVGWDVGGPPALPPPVPAPRPGVGRGSERWSVAP